MVGTGKTKCGGLIQMYLSIRFSVWFILVPGWDRDDKMWWAYNTNEIQCLIYSGTVI